MLDAYVSPPDSIRDPYSFYIPNMQYEKYVGHKRGQHTKLYYMNMGYIELVCVRKNIQKIVFEL